MFRNLRLYRLHGEWPESEDGLSSQLAEAAFEPCPPLAERSAGWEPPTGEPDAPYCRRVGGADLMRLRTQTRILPAAAINEALEERLHAFRARAQREPSRREKRELKESVHDELLPKALVKSSRLRACCLVKEKLIAVDTASETQAEHLLDQLRAALGTLQVTPLAYKRPVSELLTRIFLGDGPRNIVPGRECRMQDAALNGAFVHWSDMELTDQSVRRHVREGLKLDRLAVVYDNVLSCVLDQQGVIRKLRLQGLEGGDEIADEDPLARLDAEFVLMTGSLRRMAGDLENLLGGYA